MSALPSSVSVSSTSPRGGGAHASPWGWTGLLGVMASIGMAGGCGDALTSSPSANPGTVTAPADVVAIAGPDLVVLEGSRVALSGGLSRALVGAAELNWSQREGPSVALSNPSSPAPNFVAPVGPARLVFVVEARADDRVDVDEVVVDVVIDMALEGGSLSNAPAIVVPPGDRLAAVDELTTIRFPWTGRGTPRILPRCRTRNLEVALEEGVVVASMRPRDLPCPLVVEDDVAELGPAQRAAGRSVVVLWPSTRSSFPLTRATAPVLVHPGAEVQVQLDADGHLDVVDGRSLAITIEGGRATFTAPRTPGSLRLVAETRRDGLSGGIRPVTIEVGAGPGNVAPVVSGGPDLRVRPGARFRIVATAVDDSATAGELTFAINQVLGPGVRTTGQGGVLLAPNSESSTTMVFHVTADDGTAESAPDAVRVVVDPAAENLPPELILPPELFVVPGASFTLDTSAARDPDAGVISQTSIAQNQGDERILLPIESDAPSVTLTAGLAGERYRFVLSVVDDGGLEASASVTVIVEQAGPFVDANRGTVDGDGTPASPFVSIAAATATAVRHRFSALRLASTDDVPLAAAALPDGIGLHGGFRFVPGIDDEGGSYVDDGGESRLLLAGDLTLTGASLRQVRLTSTTSPGALVLRQQSNLRRVRAEVPTRIEAQARVLATESSFGALSIDNAFVALTSVVAGEISASRSDLQLVATNVDGEGAAGITMEAGILSADAGSTLRSDVMGLHLLSGVAQVAGAVSVDQRQGAVADGVVVDGGSLECVEARIEVSSAGNANGVRVVRADAVVSGVGTVVVSGVEACGICGGRVDLRGRLEVTGTESASGLRVDEAVLERVVVDVVASPDRAATGVVASSLTASSTVVLSAGLGSALVAESGSLRHVTVLGLDVAVDAPPALRLANSVLQAPQPFGRTPTLGIVGFLALDGVDLDLEALGCPECVVAPKGAVDDTGHLLDDAQLGEPNPLVDAGDPEDRVDVDVDGEEVPTGEAPDLGADERSVLAKKKPPP